MAGFEAYIDNVILDRDDGGGEQSVVYAVAERAFEIWDMYEDEEAIKDKQDGTLEFLERCQARGLLTPHVVTQLKTIFEDDEDRDLAFLATYLTSP
jgi:hypothetical protein